MYLNSEYWKATGFGSNPELDILGLYECLLLSNPWERQRTAQCNKINSDFWGIQANIGISILLLVLWVKVRCLISPSCGFSIRIRWLVEITNEVSGTEWALIKNNGFICWWSQLRYWLNVRLWTGHVQHGFCFLIHKKKSCTRRM